jgi:uncharacterized membrane protein
MQPSKIKTIAYWFTTGLLALDLLAGGAFSFLHPSQTLTVLQHLGYPAYFASILGFWKLLGGIALLVPGMPVLKEWAYAGICFDLTSAAVSLAASGDGAPQIAAPLVCAVLASASYVLRPRDRTVLAFEATAAAGEQRPTATV